MKANLSREQVKNLLVLAKDTSDKDWQLISYLVATGQRLDQAVDFFGRLGESRKVLRRCFMQMLKRYNVTAHAARLAYAQELHAIGVHQKIIIRLIGDQT
jgi:hypothetical protein